MSAAVCTLPDRRGKLVLVMGRKPGGVVEGAIRDADKERNYSIRSEEKGGRRGACSAEFPIRSLHKIFVAE